MKIAENFCRGIDIVNTRVAEAVRWLALPLVVVVMIEVVMRYFFNHPTIWAWDITTQFLALIAVLGAGYTLLQGMHVRVDVIVSRFSPRVNAVIDLVMATLFFIGVGVLVWMFREEAWRSLVAREPYETLWAPPIYPTKILVFIGLCLLLLQGVAKFIRSLTTITHLKVDSKP